VTLKDRSTLGVCTKFDRNRTIRGEVIDDLANFRLPYVTL